MQQREFKQHIPLLFLLIISCWWAWYYSGKHALNDYGAANFEWLYLLDGLLVLPILCFCCIRDKKQALVKSLAYMAMVVLIGSFIIPKQDKSLWHWLEMGRYLLIGGFLLFELSALATVLLAVKTALTRSVDPEVAVQSPIAKMVGTGALSQILAFETRVWTYALFSQRLSQNNFEGCKHFSYHHKDGAKSNALGFILIILFELPIMHLLLHFLWSPLAANIITFLTGLSLLLFIAEYRAMSIRPVSVTRQDLIIRYGLLAPLSIPFKNIKSISPNNAFIARDKHIKRYNFAGVPNIKIELKQAEDGVSSIYLGVDDARGFIAEINKRCM